MKNRRVVTCLCAGVFLLAACSGKKPEHPTTTENNRAAAAPTQPAPEAVPSASPAIPNQAAEATPPKQPAPAVKPAPEPKRSVTTSAVKPTPPPPKTVVIPAGTVLTVRLQQAVSSKTSQEGERFEAALAEPIVIDGKTAVPAGAPAAGTVTSAQSAGRFKGAASLGLVLNTVTIHGTPYRIQTTTVDQTSKGKGKRTAAMVGGGAGGGALIGGLAGGGKGAAIGALVGAGAGTAGSALTGNNNEITVPAEGAVSFRLTSAITLKPASTTAAANE